jgi:glycogen synthase
MDRYYDPPAWEWMMKQAMSRDFGWPRSAEKYLQVYRRALEALRHA